jgi:hypothetical protein
MRQWLCPSCKANTPPGATICAGCKTPLAQCPWCRELTSLATMTQGSFLRRELYSCDRCSRPGVKCRTWTMGGYCNGLARGEGRGKQLCANCTSAFLSATKTIAAWTLMGIIGNMLRPRPR